MFQNSELLAKHEVFKKQPAMTTEEANKSADQKTDSTYHAQVISQFACERQRRILLKLQADRVLARECVQGE